MIAGVQAKSSQISEIVMQRPSIMENASNKDDVLWHHHSQDLFKQNSTGPGQQHKEGTCFDKNARDVEEWLHRKTKLKGN